MAATLKQINSVDQFDMLMSESFVRPVLLVKHSSTCGTSADIMYQLKSINAEINVLIVQESRPLSDHVANHLGHRHHSPQAFVIVNGAACYHATHYGIDPLEIERRLSTTTAAAI